MNNHNQILKDLNDEQRNAVRTTDGPLLIIAGAGTGKTRVIEHRVAWLIAQGVNPASILLLTFTRRAARAMLRRAKALDKQAENVAGGTFHSFCLELLRRHYARLGLNATFTVIDPDDGEDLIERVVRKADLRKSRGANFATAKTIGRVFSHARNNDLPLKAALEALAPDWLHSEKPLQAVRDAYQRAKLDRDYVDFDDLLAYAGLLLAEHADIRQATQTCFRYVMVDEYQDTNLAQARLIKLIGGGGNPTLSSHVMVVGDPAQSIYSFRGARYANIMEFEQDWPGCRVIRLEINYRSTGAILDVANAVDQLMIERYDRVLRAHQAAAFTEQPSLTVKGSGSEEAGWLSDKILEHKSAGTPFEDQAILIRSMARARIIEAELLARHIPYRLVGGTALYSAAHIKDLLSVLRLVENRSDDVALQRILLRYPGIGAVKSEEIIARVIGEADDAAFLAKLSSAIGGHTPILEDLVTSFRAAMDRSLALYERLTQVIEHLTPMFRQVRDYQDNIDERLRDFEALAAISADHSDIGSFLAAMTLDGPTAGQSIGPDVKADERPLTVSTIHSAKGLEWDVVYIPALNDGHLPSTYALNSPDDVEEEKRVFYVAVTRARKFLHLSLPLFYDGAGRTIVAEPSPFAEDVGVRATLDERFDVQPAEQPRPESEGDRQAKEALLERVLKGFH